VYEKARDALEQRGMDELRGAQRCRDRERVRGERWDTGYGRRIGCFTVTEETTHWVKGGGVAGLWEVGLEMVSKAGSRCLIRGNDETLVGIRRAEVRGEGIRMCREGGIKSCCNYV